MNTEFNILKFQSITKYDLISFLKDVNDFFSYDYSEIDSYFSGNTEFFDIIKFKNLEKISKEIKNVIDLFVNYSNRLSDCGQWELLELIGNLESKIEKINKLHKYKNTSKTKKGYKRIIQIKTKLGGYKDIETVSESIGTSDWISLMRNNDMYEKDWEIDKIRDLNVYVDKKMINVNSIIGELIGEKVYGVDIKKKIEIKNNDLELVFFENNLFQKIDILSILSKGDVPENKKLGKTNLIGENRSVFSYNMIREEIIRTFMQNDLFEKIEILNISEDNDGNIIFSVGILTKFNDNLKKTVNL